MSGFFSPAAQAVLDEAMSRTSAGESESYVCWIVATALHALADHAGSAKHWHVDQLRAIAAELEGGR